MLHRLAIRDFVIVDALELEFAPGLTVLTGETGAGKSILVDALQLALGGRGEGGVVREGSARAEITAEFDAPAPLAGWLAEAGFEAGPEEDAGRLLLRRTIDAQGKSRAWINGGAATVGQLREAGEQLVDIHGQHAWQSLTRASRGCSAIGTTLSRKSSNTASRPTRSSPSRPPTFRRRPKTRRSSASRQFTRWTI